MKDCNKVDENRPKSPIKPLDLPENNSKIWVLNDFRGLKTSYYYKREGN